MRPTLFAGALAVLFVACEVAHPVKVTFGKNDQGLDGFLCKDGNNQMLLDRLRPAFADAGVGGPDGGVARASLVTDFIATEGLQDCRLSEIIDWCKGHACGPVKTGRFCTDVQLPYGVTGVPRETVRLLVSAQLKQLAGQVTADAPDGFVMMRAIATSQPCSEVMPQASGVLPEYDKTRLVGCAYSCPLLFDQLKQDVYLGFDTPTASCEQGVRTCSDSLLKWNP